MFGAWFLIYEKQYSRTGVHHHEVGPYLVQAVTSFPPQPWLRPRSGHVPFLVGKVVLGNVSSEYLGFPNISHFINYSTFINCHIIDAIQFQYSQCC
jgi:hypothetical protein